MNPYVYQPKLPQTVAKMTIPATPLACDLPSIRHRLRQDTLLNALPDVAIDQVLGRGQLLRVEAGQTVHSKQARSDHLYRLMSGMVRLSSASAEGREAIYSYLGPDEWFGHIGLVDGGTRTHDIHACGPCLVFALGRSELQRLLDHYPVLYRDFALLLCRQMRVSFAMLEDRSLMSLEGRLAKHLLALADAYGIDGPDGRLIDLPLPQEALGQLLHASRQTINRKLAQWARLGIIQVRYRRILVVDRAQLASLAG
ncbi:MAG: Crp/Fnr family transcriptional regulator [Halomonas sp.]|uniref:Crp/Fnr family transcriptional regulator n=1 Tax=unclassified Halomonas TaxID=2609666 RepID=UPI003CE98671